ncbi:MAG: hypothetical protein CVV57_01495 [Tenericutes bacterium HGW-Tenericutes-2]|jgi:hypothetical protein|nr:MAG: hypothetical protein CVV57_01495 [Tenericutes bacterium HGW-Tenericutes-2]
MENNYLTYYWFPDKQTENAVLMVNSITNDFQPIANLISLDIRSNFNVFIKDLYWHKNILKKDYVFIGNYCTCTINNNRVYISNDDENTKHEFSLEILKKMIYEWESIYIDNMMFYEFSSKKTRSRNYELFSIDCTRNLIRIFSYYLTNGVLNTESPEERYSSIMKISLIKCSDIYKISVNRLIKSVLTILVTNSKKLELSSENINILLNHIDYLNENTNIELSSELYFNIANIINYILVNHLFDLIVP